MNNNMLIDKTVDITISKMNSSNIAVDENGGKNVAAFMQEIYNKLIELNQNRNPSILQVILYHLQKHPSTEHIFVGCIFYTLF